MKRGFTLLEIIVAVAVLGISVGVAMQIFSGGLKNIYRIQLAHEAMNHAENVMNEILADESIIGPMELSGDLDENFNYTADVGLWEPPDRATLQLDITQDRFDLLQVTVQIHYKNDRFGKIYQAVCLKAVSRQTQGGQNPLQMPPDPIQQLFGGRRP